MDYTVQYGRYHGREPLQPMSFVNKSFVIMERDELDWGLFFYYKYDNLIVSKKFLCILLWFVM